MEVKLKIKVKDVEIELSKSDAEELRKLLNELCGERVVKEYVPYYPYWHYWFDKATWTIATPNTCEYKWATVGNTSNVAKIGDNIQVSYCMS